MSARGLFAVDRDIWNDALFDDPAPLSRREAWLWLISEATPVPCRRCIAGHLVALARGQLAATLRGLARDWRWSAGKVKRFLSRLRDERMVEADLGDDTTLITICKYSTYQPSPDYDPPPGGAPVGAALKQARNVSGAATTHLRRTLRLPAPAPAGGLFIYLGGLYDVDSMAQFAANMRADLAPASVSFA